MLSNTVKDVPANEPETALLDRLFALMEPELVGGGKSYTEAAFPAIKWLLDSHLETEFIKAHGATVLGLLRRHRNRGTRSGTFVRTPENTTTVCALPPLTEGFGHRAGSLAHGNAGDVAPTGDRLNHDWAKYGVFNSYATIEGTQKKIGDMRKSDCLCLALDYERRSNHNVRLAKFWNDRASEMNTTVTVSTQWTEIVFSKLMTEARAGRA